MPRPEGTGAAAVFLSGEQVALVALELERVGGEQGLRNRTIWQLAVSLNFRVGEVLSLRVGDVWWVDGGKPYDQVAIDCTRTKTKQSREVELDPHGQTVLVRWMSARGKVSPASWLFPSSQRPDQPVSYKQYEKQLVKVGRALGIPRLRSHSARKSGANLCRRLGFDLEQIRESLGHSSLQETRHYLGADRDERAEMAQAKGRYLRQCEERIQPPLQSLPDPV